MDRTKPVAIETAPGSAAAHTADRLGIAASATCAVHCAATALTPGLLGVLGLGALLGHEAEWTFTLIAAVLAAAALVQGWRVHRSVVITSAFVAGIAGLLLSRLVEESGAHGVGTGVGVFAAGALVVAHVLNIRSGRASARRRAM